MDGRFVFPTAKAMGHPTENTGKTLFSTTFGKGPGRYMTFYGGLLCGFHGRLLAGLLISQ